MSRFIPALLVLALAAVRAHAGPPQTAERTAMAEWCRRHVLGEPAEEFSLHHFKGSVLEKDDSLPRRTVLDPLAASDGKAP